MYLVLSGEAVVFAEQLLFVDDELGACERLLLGRLALDLEVTQLAVRVPQLDQTLTISQLLISQ